MTITFQETMIKLKVVEPLSHVPRLDYEFTAVLYHQTDNDEVPPPPSQ
jgi:hypothetical protein